MLALGAVVLAVGMVAAGALWYAGGQRFDDNVADFARAPSGCATTLDFTRTGEFTLYVETTGSLDDLAGDCAADTEYDRDEVTDAQIRLVDPDGAVVDIADEADGSYDTGGFTGSSVGVVQIGTPGEHLMTVAADGDQFAIAVGGDPNDGVGLLRWGAVAVAIVSLVVGGLLLVLGARRPPQTAVSDESRWEPQATPSTWPVGPPGFPAPPPTTGATGPAGPPLAPPASGPAPNVPAGPAQPSPWGPPSISNGA